MFYILLVIISLPIVLTILFRSPLIQTLSARLATNIISSKLERNISIESLNLSFYKGLYLGNVKAYDHKNNPIILVKSLFAKPDFPWLSKFNFHNVEIDGATFVYGRYKEDKDFAFIKFLGLDKKEKTERGMDFILESEKVKLTNSKFRLFDETKSYSNDAGMDYADIQINGINGFLENFHIVNDSLNFHIIMLRAVENCGMEIENLSSDFSISPSGLHALNTRMSTKKSRLDFDLDFNYSEYSDMSEFVDSVDMQGEIRKSELDLSDLGYFADIMFKMPDKVFVSGTISGKVKELTGDNIVAEYGENTSFTGDMYIRGLPDFFTSYISVGIHDFKSSKCDLQSFIIPIEEKNIEIPLDIDCAGKISMFGNFEGYYGKFVSNLDIGLPDSRLTASINFDENRNDSIFISAKLMGENLNIGKYLKIPEISSAVSFEGDIEIKGTSTDNLNYSFNTLISQIGLLAYNYNRIKFDGNYYQNKLNGNFRIGDRNLMAFGNLSFADEADDVLKVNTEIARVNLNELGFWNLDELSLSTNLVFTAKSLNPDKMNAELTMKNTHVIFGRDKYEIDSLRIIKQYDELLGSKLILKSDIANALLEGNFLLTNIAANSIGVINHYYPIVKSMEKDSISKNAHLSLEILDNTIIHDHLVKGLELEKGTKASLEFDFENNMLDISMLSNRIAYSGIDLLDNSFVANTSDGSLKLDYNIKSVIFKDSTESDKSVLGLDDFEFNSNIEDKKLEFSLFWYKSDTVLLNNGKIIGILINDSLGETLKVNEVDVFVNGVNWKIDTSNSINFNTHGIHFNNLHVFAGNSRLDINGGLRGLETDTLEIVFDRWDISYFDIISKPFNIDLDGIIDGYLNIGMVGKNPTLISNVKVDGFKLNNQYLGKARILNTWDNINKSIYFKGQIIDDSDDKVNEMFHASGFYFPFREKDGLDISLKFRDFKLPSIEAFINSYVSEIKGQTSGEIKINGTIEKPILTGFAKINQSSMIVNYLNTRYSFSNIIVFEEDMLRFDKLVLYDTLGNNAKIKGYLKHKNFNDLWLDVNLSSDKLLFFNTTHKMNELYYGKGILSGDINITGKPNDIKLDITTSTKQGTRVFLPLDYSTEVSDKDYIIFVKSELDSIADQELLMKKVNRKKEKELKYDINLDMNITPTARINIAMPSNMGDIEAQGSGDLKLDVNSDGEMNLFGEYVVSKGMFNFTIENLVNKRFELVKGGRIAWTGDPYTANINLKGLYKVKANLSSLGVVVDTTSSYKNKVNVECYINLQNQLLNPTIKFEIRMPELDPDLQRAVYAELDTTNTAMLNQQMISLLVLGTFSYSNASNINLSTSYYTILTNQLSGMLSQISDDFDIGVNYKPGDDITSEEFEVALSTQLFDDRLIIDGNFGVSYDRSHQNTSNIVGDVDIIYKITEDGRWVLKAYNHSNVNSWYYYNDYDKISPYTQGVGVAFRKEFNKFGELFKRSRKRQIKKDEKKKK